jgi:hypothetical protein
MVATQPQVHPALIRSLALIGAVYSNTLSAPVCRTYLFPTSEDLNDVMAACVAHHRDNPGGDK